MTPRFAGSLPGAPIRESGDRARPPWYPSRDARGWARRLTLQAGDDGRATGSANCRGGRGGRAYPAPGQSEMSALRQEAEKAQAGGSCTP
jgi:hypothetical protein